MQPVLLLILVTICAAVPGTTYLDFGTFGRSPSLSDRFAAQVCAGLAARDPNTHGSVYTVGGDKRDLDWLVSTHNNDTIVDNATITDISVFVRRCLHGDPALKLAPIAQGWMRYDFETQKVVVPNLVTLAAVMDVIPVQDTDVVRFGLGAIAPLFDALKQFPVSLTNDTANAPRAVTAWVFDHFANSTTGAAKMNPGLDVHGSHKINPPLTRDPDLGLIDFIVKQRLFNFFLNLGCVPLTADHKLMERIAKTNPWPRPLVVWGYDDTIAIAGDLFEAETDCVSEHDMGQVASNGCSNLAFFASRPAGPVAAPLQQVPDPPSMALPYNESLTYVAIIMGDGDNLNFVKGSRRDWMIERTAYCAAVAPDPCFPLVWTLSPAALHAAPDFVRWYYSQATRTKADYFVLPPSGHSYAYPGQMSADDQVRFVAATEADARLMNTSATVSWELLATWPHALEHYFPRFGHAGIVRTAFAVNVPFMVPVLSFAGAHYKVLGSGDDQVVVFAPREWRGNGSTADPLEKPAVLSPKAMAAELSNYPRGTVSHVYTTSDGGFSFQQLVEMQAALADHVRLVSSNEVGLRALQRDRATRT